MLEEALTSLIQAYGPPGLLIVMIIQTIIAPISSEAMVVSAAAIGIPILKVIIFAGIGTIIGAILAFWIARKGGRPVLEKIVGDDWIENLDKWINKNGKKGIFITRIIPIIPFDLISYISGITSLSFKDYMIATLFGVFPRMLILSLIGETVAKTMKWIGAGLELMIALILIGFITLIILDKKGYIGGFKRFVFKRLLRN